MKRAPDADGLVLSLHRFATHTDESMRQLVSVEPNLQAAGAESPGACVSSPDRRCAASVCKQPVRMLCKGGVDSRLANYGVCRRRVRTCSSVLRHTFQVWTAVLVPQLLCSANVLTVSWAWQAPVWSPTLVPALSGTALLRSGQHHTLALTHAGALLSAGRPTYGRLGRAGVDVGSDDAVPAAAPVEGLEGVEIAGVAAGAHIG